MMQQKSLTFVLCAILLLSLCACSLDAETSTAEPDVDLSAFWTSLMEQCEIPNTTPADAEMLDTFYPGLTGVATSQCVVQLATISAVAFEVAMVRCENAADTAEVSEIFRARIQAQTEGGAWYPETIATWEQAQVLVQGSYVLLACGSNATEIVQAFQAACA